MARRIGCAAVRGILLLVVAAVVACDGPPAATPSNGSAAQVIGIADAIVDDEFAEVPELGARLRPPGARFDFLPGDSLADYAARDAREDQWRATLASIDRASLGDSPAGLAHDVAVEALAARNQA